MAKRFYLRGIQAKTFFIFFFVFLSIIIPVNFFIFNKVRSILAASDTGELKAEAERLLSQTRLDPQSIPLPAQGYALKLQLNSDLFFEEVFTSSDFPEMEPVYYFLNEIEVDTFKIVTLRRPESSSTQLVFSLARSNQRLEKQLDDLRFYLFAANASSILLAAVVVLIASGITLRPVRRIIQVADRINASKSMERVPVPKARDENRLLAETINSMLARIELTIQNQTNFFASAAHELKTPLTVMQTELSIALQTEKNPDVVRILQSNLVEAQRLDRVIQDFLLISQLRSDSLILRKQSVELDEIFYSALKKVKYLAKEKNNSVQVTMDDRPFFVMADHDKMETVVSNLLENAMKYSPVASVTSVTLQKQPDRVLLSVCNSLEKPIANLDQLKEEYRKSEELSSGLGMGLWICDRIVALHDARLELTQKDLQFIARISFAAAEQH